MEGDLSMDIMFSRRNNQVIILAVFFTACLILCGCMGNDRNHGRRPSDFCPSVWVCEEHGMILEVSDKGETTLQTSENSIQYEYSCNFDRGVYMEILNSQKIVFRGSCVFSSEKVEITVVQNDLFGNIQPGDMLVFIKRTDK